MSSTDTEEAPVDPAVEPDLKPPTRFTPDPEEPDRHIVGELVTEEDPDADPDKGEDVELTDAERRDFATLITCGRRSKKITVMGHAVVIQTLTTADEMRVGLFTKRFSDTTLGFQRAYQVGVCAAGIRTVQGRPLFSDLREITDEDEIFDRKAEAVQEYYPVVVTQIYQAIMDLEREFAELAIKLGKLGKPEG